MKKKKVITIIEDMIDDVKSGNTQHFDVPHKPSEKERIGRVKMLEKLIEQIQDPRD